MIKIQLIAVGFRKNFNQAVAAPGGVEGVSLSINPVFLKIYPVGGKIFFQVVRWSGGQVVRWSGGQVVRWSGGQVVRWSGGQAGRVVFNLI